MHETVLRAPTRIHDEVQIHHVVITLPIALQILDDLGVERTGLPKGRAPLKATWTNSKGQQLYTMMFAREDGRYSTLTGDDPTFFYSESQILEAIKSTEVRI